MECFGTTDFDNSSRLITLSAIIISSLHCICSVKSKEDEVDGVCDQYGEKRNPYTALAVKPQRRKFLGRTRMGCCMLH